VIKKSDYFLQNQDDHSFDRIPKVGPVENI